jgi:hypothetical protein
VLYAPVPLKSHTWAVDRSCHHLLQALQVHVLDPAIYMLASCDWRIKRCYRESSVVEVKLQLQKVSVKHLLFFSSYKMTCFMCITAHAFARLNATYALHLSVIAFFYRT